MICVSQQWQCWKKLCVAISEENAIALRDIRLPFLKTVDPTIDIVLGGSHLSLTTQFPSAFLLF